MPDQHQPPPPTPANDYRAQVLLASRNLFQQRLRKLVSEAGGNISASLDAFSREVGDAHDVLASANPLDGFDQVASLTASRLTLMGDDDLEVGIRLREIATHLRDAGGRELWRSRSLYLTLLDRTTMGPDNNPVGPEAICEGLAALCAQHDGSIEQTFAMLDRVEDLLCQGLPALYAEINELLTKLGVEPAQAHYTANVASPARPAGGQAASAGTQPATNALLLLQDVLRHRSGLLQAGAGGHFVAADGQAEAANPLLDDAAAAYMLKDLLERLTALELRSASSPAAGHDESSPSAPRPLKSSDLDVPLGRTEALTLDTMALIFEAIFESADIPDAVKGIIGRLQIPLLKQAIVDPTLFANNQHPARLLINRMARAAVGLPPNTGVDHPLCKRIAAIASALRDPREESGDGLGKALAELDALVNEGDQAVRAAAAGHIRLVVEHEQAIAAQQAAETWLRASLARTRSPEIAAFLERYWVRVMAAAAQAGGTEGARWQQDSATGGELIWSVQPKQTNEERKHLAGMASSLIKRIGGGLDGIGISSAERLPFLNRLFDLQTAALRGQAQEKVTPAGLPLERRSQGRPASGPAAKGGTCALGSGELQVHYLAHADDEATARAAASSGWQVGDWLRFALPDREQEPLCGLCCWQSPSSHTVLLFNPVWGYAVALPSALLEQQVRAGRAQVVSGMATFDSAAERALRLLD
ncbi:MAG: hypothetical protein AW11_02468 [Candidatus Accumulibacter regalis]|jgi:Protein of unknown function (DUF1631).|uniref:Thymidine phosphorylase n=2 Tax=Candidatus Accumulibacter TaxID=327159 RepID=A0A011R8Y5_ACCRE|nr:DUF1631 family protein [Accumulibacter sp.]EXI87604.1 MAG: hypothetical protein AW11_02468 [Candidatus Accumulibacter regalis]MBN8512828.1 DUF1631 family protein [Accumulibacter sp.]HRE69632.1 DUF1631 family protein [Accumulibacter sp.]HRE86475.1 DUF1631 family protein [Accumulibacter sp.]